MTSDGRALAGPVTAEPGEPIVVRLRNTGATPISFESGIATATIVEPGTLTEVGGYNGGIAAIGIGVDLAPSEEMTIEGVTGIALCDPADGTRVPAGSYELIAELQGPDPAGLPLLSAPLAIVVA